MKVEIKEKNENTLLKRLELKGLLDFEGVTPSNLQIAEVLAKETKKDINLVVVKNIYTDFGHQKGNFSAFVYESEEAKSKTERVTKHMKKKAEEAAKGAAEAKTKEAEAPAVEEKPAEEPKEEAAAEEKPTEEAKEEAAVEEKPAVEEVKEGEA